MPSRLQIERLAQRIEALGRCKAPEKPHTIVVDGELEEVALERHYREHPQDRGAPAIIIRIVAP